MVLDSNYLFIYLFLLISISSQLKIIVLNRNNFLSTFVFWLKFNFVCWINIGMIIDSCFIIPWLSSKKFQDTINNKARFMIFLLIFWTSKYLFFFRVICLILFFFLLFMFFFSPGVSLRFRNTRSNNTHSIEIFSKKFLEVYIYTFCFDRVKFGSSYLIFKDKNSIIM